MIDRRETRAVPLHPVIASMFEQFRASGRPTFSACTVAQARALMSGARAAFGSGPDLPRIADVTIETRSGSVPGRLFVPSEEPAGLVVYFHGGGWVVGTIDDFDAFARRLAQRSGCAVLLVEYRLAPETPFPGPVEDALDALAWAARSREDLLGRDVPLVVAGDSAGGNLAAVAAAATRGTIPLALQVLIYPVTDRDFDTASYRDPANAGLLTRDDMIWFFGHYAPGADRDDPRLDPLRLGDLTGLPPAFVASAEYDVLRDEGEAYANRLEAAGIPTVLRRYAGLPHGFIRMHNLVDTVDSAVTDVAQAIGRACLHQGRKRPIPLAPPA